MENASFKTSSSCRPHTALSGRHLLAPLAGFSLCAAAAAQVPIATVATTGVQLKNVLSVANGRATIANNGELTAGTNTAQVLLLRGGSLLVCASTTVQIARDSGSSTGEDAALMFSLNRGALETSYKTGSYSDVVMTPDLRLLISPPGLAQVKLRVNEQGDTCVDNSGTDAPYVTVSSLMDGGVYRVKPGQRVEFIGGSLARVVDNEREPCGCPAPEPPPDAKSSAAAAANPFPAAVSEELAPPPGPPSEPVVPDGVAHAEVQATLSSNTPPGPPPPGDEPKPAAAASTPAPARVASHKPKTGIFHSIGHFFAKVFGAD